MILLIIFPTEWGDRTNSCEARGDEEHKDRGGDVELGIPLDVEIVGLAVPPSE